MHQFTGKERDAETGLDFFGARYMSSAQGRFTTPDAPFADQHVETPQSWNLYGYVQNNPLGYIDQTGRGKLSVFYKVITKITKEGKVFKRATDIKLSRDEARRLFKKRGQDVLGSKKGARNTAGRESIHDAPHGQGAGDNNPHFHDKDRTQGHAFYKEGSAIVIPGAELGTDLFGDSIVGDVVDFLNPLSDVQDAADLVQAGVELGMESLDHGVRAYREKLMNLQVKRAQAKAAIEEAERRAKILRCKGEACPPPQ